jgi:hypothetical protein
LKEKRKTSSKNLKFQDNLGKAITSFKVPIDSTLILNFLSQEMQRKESRNSHSKEKLSQDDNEG